jgi:hypothetical protein
MILDPGFHCWRYAQGLMHTAEIVGHEAKRDRPPRGFQLASLADFKLSHYRASETGKGWLPV